jgi:hypothetical protein
MVGVFCFGNIGDKRNITALIQSDFVRHRITRVPTLWALNKLVRHMPINIHLRDSAHGALQIALNLLYILQNFNKKN